MIDSTSNTVETVAGAVFGDDFAGGRFAGDLAALALGERGGDALAGDLVGDNGALTGDLVGDDDTGVDAFAGERMLAFAGLPLSAGDLLFRIEGEDVGAILLTGERAQTLPAALTPFSATLEGRKQGVVVLWRDKGRSYRFFNMLVRSDGFFVSGCLLDAGLFATGGL